MKNRMSNCKLTVPNDRVRIMLSGTQLGHTKFSSSIDLRIGQERRHRRSILRGVLALPGSVAAQQKLSSITGGLSCSRPFAR